MFKLILASFIGWLAWRGLWRHYQGMAQLSAPEPIELKACAHCQDLVRMDRAVLRGGRIFCSSAHADMFIV